MAMAVRQARRQLQFSGFEMGLIAVSFLVTVTTVFFLGLFVGKKNASYHTPAEDRVARIPVDDFTRYKRPEPIAKTPREPKPAAVEGEGVVASAPAAAVDPKAVGSPTSPAASAPAAAAPVAEPTAKPAGAPAATDVVAVGAAKAKDLAAKDAAAKEAAAKEAKAKELAAAKAKEEKEEATGRGYTVQLLSTRKSADAEALVKKLKARGYAANIKKMADGEGAWYRVRVGSYGAFSEARAMADKCRRDLGLGQAFVSTE
jgi:septal ring-binding cell division protein DamX